MSRLFAIGIMLIALFVSAITPYQGALAQTTLRLITQFTLNNTSEVKYPNVATTGDTVHLTTNNDNDRALAFSKSTTSTSFGSPFVLGDANTSKADWTRVAATSTPDGAVYAAWINNEARSIYMRKREPNGEWGPRRIVSSSGAFDYASIAVSTTGEIFVVWREIDRPPRYSRSTDQGANWSGRREIASYVAYNENVDIAAGPNGQVAFVYTASGLEPISVIVGIWNGSEFAPSVVAGNAAAPSVAYGSDGKLYVAWRGTESSGGNAGLFYSERQANGTFPRSRLAGGSVTGTVALGTDSQGNLHLSWFANSSGNPDLFYTLKPANAGFYDPIQGPDDDYTINASGAASVTDQTYFHVAMEAFTGNTSRARYSLFAGGAVGTNANPLIEAGASLTRRGDNQVSVGFTVSGSAPNQVRWRWGAAPSDTQFDSPGAQGWTTYENPKLVAVPERIRNVCGEQVLYTQVRISGGATETTAKSDGIIIDSQVTAPGALNAYNPYSFEANNDPIATTAVELAAGKANAGDPKHTRIDAVNIELDNSTDCSGLDNLVIGKTLTNLTSPDQIVNERFDKRVFFPTNSLVRGRNDFIIRVKDKAGNERDFPDTIFFDDEDPVLSTTAPGTITITLDPQASILADLSFSNINVTDLVYDKSGRKFWGVWLAVSRTATNPDTDSTLVWTPLAAPGTSNSFTIENFSLATGLPAGSLTPGDYFVYARFLDGAGNSTTGVISATTTLTEVTQPVTFLPLIRK
jgi:hypothetical protein